mmetsp:Transcript_1885/g.4285  ORF Transcript_1885/g.4285 Transcript_1885/m.4285 type:complete len:563 (+) Transcript_1885:310-1998(+)
MASGKVLATALLCVFLCTAGCVSATSDVAKLPSLLSLLEARLLSNVSAVETVLKLHADNPLLLASHLPFLQDTCAEQNMSADSTAEEMRRVGRALVDTSSPKARETAGALLDVIRHVAGVPRRVADRVKNYVESMVSTAQPDESSGKIMTLPNTEYDIWLPDQRSFIPKNPMSPYLLILRLIDSVYLRWFTQDAKCDFFLPTVKPPYHAPEIVCTRPKIKVAYCFEFQIRTPLVQPGLPLCIPEDVMEILFNLGGFIGGFITNIADQISPYLLQLLGDYIEAGGTQEQLFKALGLLTSDSSLTSGDLGVGAIVSLLSGPALPVLLDGVDVGKLVVGDGFRGMLSTIAASGLIPAELQPTFESLGPYLPFIVSGYYECGGQTETFFDAVNSVLNDPLIKPFINNPNLLSGATGGSGGAPNMDLILATLPAAYSSVVMTNPPMYNWLNTLPAQCIVDQGYVQPVAVKLTQGTSYEQVAESLPKIVDDYYNSGCSTEQLLAIFPVLLQSQTADPADQTQILFNTKGKTPNGDEVGFTTPFNGGPSILQCLTPNLGVLVSILGNVG